MSRIVAGDQIKVILHNWTDINPKCTHKQTNVTGSIKARSIAPACLMIVFAKKHTRVRNQPDSGQHYLVASFLIS